MPISVGSVEVDVIPNTQGIYQRLRNALVPAGARAGRDAGDAAGRAFAPAMASSINGSALSAIGTQIGQQIAGRISAQIRSSLSQGITQGGASARPAATRQGEETGGAFGRAMKARLEAAFRSMPRLNVGLNDTGVDADLARLRARLETLSNKRIGIDVDAATADAEVADISERLRRLGAAHPNIAVRADTAAARAQLDAMREEIARLSADPLRIRVETDGSFGQRLRAQVQAAQASLPDINIGADTSPAQAELATLRGQLAALSDQRVGIDIDAATASARIDEIRARLRLLGVTATDISVRVDAATAEAQLAQVEAMADAVDGKDINLHVSNGEALSAIFQVAVAIAALAAIPAIPVLVAGTGSVVAAFTAAGVGVGAFAAAALPALSSIKGALDAQKQAQDAASTATAKGGQAAAQAASRSLQMAGAQQALASAERNAAQQIAQAQRQVAQAKQGVADAVQQAALRQQQAERTVANAERDLTQAQQAQKQAQLDLVEARKTAAEQLVDLNNQQKDSVLALQRAEAQVRDARKQVEADAKYGSKATKDQRADDLLALAEAKQALVEQQIETQRLTEKTSEANKAGVEGASTYKQAQDAVAQSQQVVADKTQALKDAREAEARTEVANARAIADAQAKVADAERGVAQAQAQAADSIANAQRQVQSASLSAAGATDASATAAQKYQQALAKLSPSARGTFNAFLALRTAFKSWSLALQPAIMPIFTRALNGVKNSLPGLTPLVLGAAAGIKALQDRVSAGFKSPWWQTIKKDFANSVEPAILRVGRIIGNVFVGSAGIVDAFLPHLDGVSNRSDGITKRFANFGKNLKTNPKFERFIGYAAEQAPKLGDAFGKIASAFLDTSKAIAPLSGPLLVLIGGLASGISAIANDAPGALQLIYGIFVATKLATLAQLAYTGAVVAYQAGVVLVTLLTQGWAEAQLAADAAFAANPIVAIILIIIATVGLLVAAILYAWNHWAWFRDAVKAVWSAITVAVQATIDWFKKSFIPFFTKTIPGAFTWLLGWVKAHWPLLLGILAGPFGLAAWAILHYWSTISAGLSTGWTWIKNHVLYPIRDFFLVTIPGWATSLSSHVVGAFKNMGTGVANAWKKLEDAAKKPINFVIGTVWNGGILKVWDKITGWIPGLPHMGKLPLLAQGGTLPVQPGVFNKPTAIVGEGNPAHPEYVIPTDPKYRGRALGLLQQAGAQMLAGGGIIGTITGGAKAVGGAVAGAAQGAWKGIKTAADFLADPVGNLLKLLNPITNKLKPLKSPWGKVAAGLPLAAINGLKKLVTSFGGKTGGAGDTGTHGTGAAAAQEIARTLLRAFNWAPNQMSPLIKLWNGESGWNYKATNPSSGAYGIPQALPASKMASAGNDWRTNPATQIRWGLNYISQRYGTPLIAWNKWQERQPHWYDDGGYLQPGLNLAYNGTGRPEPVFTSQQAAGLVRLATAPAGVGGGEFVGDLYLDSGEFLGKVRGEVQQGMAALATAFRAGRKG
jgi:hypothetical protein